jgi:hypothetical protein
MPGTPQVEIRPGVFHAVELDELGSPGPRGMAPPGYGGDHRGRPVSAPMARGMGDGRSPAQGLGPWGPASRKPYEMDTAELAPVRMRAAPCCALCCTSHLAVDLCCGLLGRGRGWGAGGRQHPYAHDRHHAPLCFTPPSRAGAGTDGDRDAGLAAAVLQDAHHRQSRHAARVRQGGCVVPRAVWVRSCVHTCTGRGGHA